MESLIPQEQQQTVDSVSIPFKRESTWKVELHLDGHKDRRR